MNLILNRGFRLVKPLIKSLIYHRFIYLYSKMQTLLTSWTLFTDQPYTQLKSTNTKWIEMKSHFIEERIL
jgi:hypothetical protein